MSRSKSSAGWLQEHFNDQYVKKSRQDGYRSRASYKLLEIQEKDRLLKPGMRVLDLGAAPGGWSQVAVRLVGAQGKVLASDILPMEPIAGVDFVQGDFTEDEVYRNLLAKLGDEGVDLVISDMAPNMSGISSVDIPRANQLVELALDMAGQILVPGGALLVKIFQGEGFDALLASARSNFSRVQMRKPGASRTRSREQYLLAREFRG